jgi:endonuclease/exonuclease/phosphatase family metal-dependent hydrolase
MNKEKSKKSAFVIRLLFFINVLIGVCLIGAYFNTHVSPNSIPYLAFLGLAYPIFITLIGCFFVFWLLFKRKYLLFNLIVFLLGWSHFTSFYAFNNSMSIHSANSVKVVSYNVRIFNYYDNKKKVETRDNIFNFLAKQDADVYCFQEFYHQEGSTQFKTRDTMVQFLKTKFHHERYTHEMTGQQYFGVVTFSKYPIINKGEISFDNDNNNYCIYTDLLKGRDTLRVFNAHLGSIRLQDSDYAVFGDKETGRIYKREKKEQKIIERLKVAFEKRAEQIEKVMLEIKKSPYPVIFCGDFNDTPVSYCYNNVSDYLVDAFIESGNGIGTTYIGKIPSNRIDYIFHSDDLLGTEFVTHDVNYSDHKPISCYIGN